MKQRMGKAAWALVCAWALWTGLWADGGVAVAQNTGGGEPAFEVVSIRSMLLTKTAYAGGGVTVKGFSKPCVYQPDRVECALTLRELIHEAWGIPPSHSDELDDKGLLHDTTDVGSHTGVWAPPDTKGYEVKATMPLNTPVDTARLMLRRALKDKFGLVVHYETRATKAYALVVGKGGLKLKSLESEDGNSPCGGSSFGMFAGYAGRFTAMGSMDAIAKTLGRQLNLDVPVVNGTNLGGCYKVEMNWTPGEGASGAHIGKDPNFLPALQDQTGLRIEKRETSFQVLMIDSVHLPTAKKKK
jgi:uncharacterized protein (TIGR03435 family)